MTTTDTNETELREIAQKIEAWRKERGFSHARLREVLPEYGSDKTLTKLCAGDFAELDVAKWHREYSVAVANIDAMEAGEDLAAGEVATDGGDLLENVTLALKLRQVFVNLLGTRETNRLGVIICSGGGGKTSAALALRSKYRGRVRLIQCLKVWGDRPGAMLRDIAAALHLGDQERRTNHQIYLKIRDALKGGRKCLVFDEAHYMGPECLSTIVGLMNDTPGEFIFLAKPLMWRNLERTAYEQCDQLLVNRLNEKASYAGLPETSYQKFLASRLPELNGSTAAAAKYLHDKAADLGHLAFARDVVAELRSAARGREKRPVDFDAFRAAAEIVARRLGRSAKLGLSQEGA